MDALIAWFLRLDLVYQALVLFVVADVVYLFGLVAAREVACYIWGMEAARPVFRKLAYLAWPILFPIDTVIGLVKLPLRIRRDRLYHKYLRDIPKMSNQQYRIDEILKQKAVAFQAACQTQETCRINLREAIKQGLGRSRIKRAKFARAVADYQVKASKSEFWEAREAAAAKGFIVEDSWKEYLQSHEDQQRTRDSLFPSEAARRARVA